MKTIIAIEIEHAAPIQHLADMIAGRAWSINGVKSAEVVPVERIELNAADLSRAGFTEGEIALGRGEVVRG